MALIVRLIQRRHLTYLDIAALTDLVNKVLEYEHRGIAGAFVEVGCGRGGSAIAIACGKARTRAFYVYDAFTMIPPPSLQDGPDAHARYATIVSGKAIGSGMTQYYGYENNLYDQVHQAFATFGLDPDTHAVHLMRGLFKDSLRPAFPIALAHIDCDWYESVMTALERIDPYLISGGTLIVDDYDHWSGCRRAVEEYLYHKGIDNYEYRPKSRLHIIKH